MLFHSNETENSEPRRSYLDGRCARFYSGHISKDVHQVRKALVAVHFVRHGVFRRSRAPKWSEKNLSETDARQREVTAICTSDEAKEDFLDSMQMTAETLTGQPRPSNHNLM